MLKITADSNMPHIEKLFADIAQVSLVDGRRMQAKDVANADALLVRSITQVDAKLLGHSQIKFVGSATIGIDHLDQSWLAESGITWASAAGCNADAVVQYVLSAIAGWCLENNRQLDELEIGIVGAGNVGGRLAIALQTLGIRFRLCDPPLESNGDPRNFYALEALMDCDVITLHTPLNTSGQNKTIHLFNKHRLQSLGSDQLLINASRGAVIDNLALYHRLLQVDAPKVVLDVFENEPAIDWRLIPLCFYATPHIAGHTLEGKLRGSTMVYEACCRHFGLTPRLGISDLLPVANKLTPDDQSGNDRELLLKIFDIRNDDSILQGILENELLPADRKLAFDQSRKDYPSMARQYSRRDYSGWLRPDAGTSKIFQLLGVNQDNG